jgi:TetR/AcrR family transcriptional regulator, lmrAB and yxaGH operons repressor
MPESDSRRRAIETAALLFQQQGYPATGVAEIIERSGTPKGSFYFNFPRGKEQLAAEALTRAGGQFAGAIEKLAERAGDADAFLRSLLSVLAAGLEASDFSLGCPIATVALESATASEPLRLTAQAQFAAWEDAIARGLAGGRRPARKHRARAELVLMMLEGALLMSRVRRSPEPLHSLAPAFKALLAK